MAKVGEGDERWIVSERQDGANVHGWHWQEKDCLAWAKVRTHTAGAPSDDTARAGQRPGGTPRRQCKCFWKALTWQRAVQPAAGCAGGWRTGHADEEGGAVPRWMCRVEQQASGQPASGLAGLIGAGYGQLARSAAALPPRRVRAPVPPPHARALPRRRVVSLPPGPGLGSQAHSAIAGGRVGCCGGHLRLTQLLAPHRSAMASCWAAKWCARMRAG